MSCETVLLSTGFNHPSSAVELMPPRDVVLLVFHELYFSSSLLRMYFNCPQAPICRVIPQFCRHRQTVIKKHLKFDGQAMFEAVKVEFGSKALSHCIVLTIALAAVLLGL